MNYELASFKRVLKKEKYQSTDIFLVKAIVISCLFFISCESNKGSSNLHPDQNLVFHDNTKYSEVTKRNMKRWEEDFSIDIKDTVMIDISNTKYKIHSVTDALIKDDELLILDDGSTKIHSIGFDGLPNEPVANTGRGPGEVASPVNLVSKQEGFVVMDRVNGIIFFDNNNKAVNFERIKFMPDHFCMLDNYFVKSSYFSNDKEVNKNLIFEVNKKNEIVNKYSQKYAHENNKLVYFMSSGPIKCVNKYDTLVNSYTLVLPLIEFYNVETNEAKKYKLTDINPYKYKFQGTLRPADVNLGTTYHRNGNLTVLRNRFVVLQFYEIDRPQNPEAEFKPQILSYVFDLKSEEIYFSYNLPYFRATSFRKIFVKSHINEYNFSLHTYELVKY